MIYLNSMVERRLEAGLDGDINTMVCERWPVGGSGALITFHFGRLIYSENGPY